MQRSGSQAVPQRVIPAKSHDFSWALTNCWTRAGIQKKAENRKNLLTLDSANASLGILFISAYRLRYGNQCQVVAGTGIAFRIDPNNVKTEHRPKHRNEA